VLWHWIEDHQLSNRLDEGYGQLAERNSCMWQKLTLEVIKALCA
jgi:hypothetical protein